MKINMLDAVNAAKNIPILEKKHLQFLDVIIAMRLLQEI
jgi:hypothetical protein